VNILKNKLKTLIFLFPCFHLLRRIAQTYLSRHDVTSLDVRTIAFSDAGPKALSPPPHIDRKGYSNLTIFVFRWSPALDFLLRPAFITSFTPRNSSWSHTQSRKFLSVNFLEFHSWGCFGRVCALRVASSCCKTVCVCTQPCGGFWASQLSRWSDYVIFPRQIHLAWNRNILSWYYRHGSLVATGLLDGWTNWKWFRAVENPVWWRKTPMLFVRPVLLGIPNQVCACGVYVVSMDSNGLFVYCS
jgi:hypothetical protein